MHPTPMTAWDMVLMFLGLLGVLHMAWLRMPPCGQVSGDRAFVCFHLALTAGALCNLVIQMRWAALSQRFAVYRWVEHIPARLRPYLPGRIGSCACTSADSSACCHPASMMVVCWYPSCKHLTLFQSSKLLSCCAALCCAGLRCAVLCITALGFVMQQGMAAK